MVFLLHSAFTHPFRHSHINLYLLLTFFQTLRTTDIVDYYFLLCEILCISNHICWFFKFSFLANMFNLPVLLSVISCRVSSSWMFSHESTNSRWRMRWFYVVPRWDSSVTTRSVSTRAAQVEGCMFFSIMHFMYCDKIGNSYQWEKFWRFKTLVTLHTNLRCLAPVFVWTYTSRVVFFRSVFSCKTQYRLTRQEFLY